MVIIIFSNPMQMFYDPPFLQRVEAADDVDCINRYLDKSSVTERNTIYPTLAHGFESVKRKIAKWSEPPPKVAQKGQRHMNV